MPGACCERRARGYTLDATGDDHDDKGDNMQSFQDIDQTPINGGSNDGRERKMTCRALSFPGTLGPTALLIASIPHGKKRTLGIRV